MNDDTPRVRPAARAESLLEAHGRVLELVAAAAPLEASLTELARLVEAHADGTAVAVMVMDPHSEHLRLAAAPSLSPEFRETLQALTVGPNGGSCGIAAYRGEAIVTEIATDPAWAGLRDTALAFGVTRSSSTPVLSTTGEALGTLALYYGAERDPPGDDAEIVKLATRTAAVAIERRRLLDDREGLLDLERQARLEAESRAQAAVSLEYVADGVCLVDEGGVVRVWNPAAVRILGIDESAVVGRRIVDVLPAWEAAVDQVRTTGGSGAPVTVPIELADRELWLSVSAGSFEGGSVYAFRDVTSERRLEEFRGDVVATVSHELRTPLAAVYGAAKTLRRHGLGGEQGALLVEVLSIEAERLRDLVEEILLASQLDSGSKVRVMIEEVDAGALARSVADAFAANTGADIAVDAPGEPVRVCADEGRLRQVLNNLVDNAVKYGSRGVRVSLSSLPGSVLLAVSDEGPGIPLRDQERVFEKFARLDPNLQHGVSGTGLGLYITRELVERMGGSIRLESAEGEGTTFVVELPPASA